ncbi:helix-turn-helix domain-containing protein [Actinomadura chokoriensis]|uniref:MerR family transcriptional regulator n=1 Tax=Actinomadura chokoriensis TaxID=454156 RepID=A0ABV4R364_9ACTN
MDDTWTIGELAKHAAAALAADGAAQVSGRVRDLPNARLIRWYTTIGLVDPPLGRRGRTALYGPRHLLQLIAVKRRQAEGRSIAEIQVELAAAPDETLARIAALPAGSPTPPTWAASSSGTDELSETRRPQQDQGQPSAPPRPARGVPQPAPPAGAPTDHRIAQAEPTGQAEHTASAGEGVNTTGDPAGSSALGRPATRAGGSADAADPAAPSDGVRDAPAKPADGEAGQRGNFWSARPDVSYGRASVSADYGRPLPPVVQGVRLAPGLTLLLDGPALSDDDLAAIDTAARPLLDELHRRGLLTPAQSPAFSSEAHSRRSP